MQIKHLYTTNHAPERFCTYPGKEEKAGQQRKASPGLPLANLVSRVLSFSNMAAISENEKTLGTMLLTCIMADEEAQTNIDCVIRYFCINFW